MKQELQSFKTKAELEEPKHSLSRLRDKFKKGLSYATDIVIDANCVKKDFEVAGAKVPTKINRLTNTREDQQTNTNAHRTVMRAFGKESDKPPLYKAMAAMACNRGKSKGV